jgi:hypothetical protein
LIEAQELLLRITLALGDSDRAREIQTQLNELKASRGRAPGVRDEPSDDN